MEKKNNTLQLLTTRFRINKKNDFQTPSPQTLISLFLSYSRNCCPCISKSGIPSGMLGLIKTTSRLIGYVNILVGFYATNLSSLQFQNG